jgi:hypothetical protein|tara:strand:+ start:485 stop:703 length:219 start_codon:yes stop_codon:yes gene_type:complete
MITNKRPKKTKIEIDLLGPEGNAFALLGIARDLAIKLDLDWNYIHTEMTSGDYENLLQVMEHYFGDIIVMYR